MDAILSLGVTQLIDMLTTEKVDLSVLSLDQRRDLLLLAALYDASTGEPIERRWSRLRRRSGFRPLWSRRDLQIGFGTTLVVIALIAAFPFLRGWTVLPWLLVPVLAGWIYWGWRLLRAEWYRARHSQRAESAQSRFLGTALGAALVQAQRARRTTPTDAGTTSRGTLRIAPEVPGGAGHSWLSAASSC